MRSLLTSLVFTLCWPLASAQDAGPSASAARFEVAAIRRNIEANPRQNIGVAPGGRVTVTNMPIRFLIRFAYRVEDFQIAGGPSWMNTDTYDINAKASGNVGPEQMRPLLRTLLEDRFKLIVHHETKEMPVYELYPTKGGFKSELSKDASCVSPDPKNLPKPGEPLPHFCGNIGVGPHSIEAYSIPMNRFVAALSSVLGRVVIDETGIKDKVTIHLEFATDELNGSLTRGGPGESASASPATDTSKPSIFAAVQEQLGLKLESTKAPGDILVVDQLERPSEN